MPLRLGTRASALARWQAEWVAARLREQGVEVELVPISTTGDQQQGTIQNIGGQGLFTKEIQRALLDDRIDLAVHSLKDLPTAPTLPAPSETPREDETAPGLCLAAVPERAPPSDVLASPKYASLDALPIGAILGTGSLRRRAQLLHVRPDLQMRDIRGNVETRLRKLHQGDFDTIVLAEAGLRRLGLEKEIVQVLPLEVMLPAVGQGALALEIRTDDETTRQIVATLDHPPTHAAVLAERAMLAALQGGCLAPIAAFARVDADQLTLTGRVISHDGVHQLEATANIELLADQNETFSRLLKKGTGSELPDVNAAQNSSGEVPVPLVQQAVSRRHDDDLPASAAVQLGQRVAETLLAQGAGELISSARRP